MSEDETRREPVRSLADLVVPRRPAGVPYDQGEDVDAGALLAANGYTEETDELIALLDSPLAVFQSAAARILGARRERGAIDALQRLANDTRAEEVPRVQAAFALARMDVAGARDLLIALLALSVEASPAPLQAAGALAILGDPRGFATVRLALDSPNRVTAMVACKQLYAFAAHDGLSLPDGHRVDVFGAFRRALRRPEPAIAGEARAQLVALGTPQAQEVLHEEIP